MTSSYIPTSISFPLIFSMRGNTRPCWLVAVSVSWLGCRPGAVVD